MRYGLSFNQNAIVSFKTPRRFDKRYRDPSIVVQEDLIVIGEYWYLKDYENQFGHGDQEDYYLFLDEKIVDKSKSFTLLGTMIAKSEIQKLDTFTKRFKQSLKPKLSPDNWYMKGDGKHIYKYKLINDTIDDFYQARRRWKILGDMLESIDVNHSFHISTVDMNDYKINHKKIDHKKVEYDAMINMLKSLEMFKYNTLTIVIDNVDESMKENYQKAIDDFYGKSDFIKFKVQVKDDFVSYKSNLLQYVDTFLYAITRFIYPNEHNDKYNILVDFELFRYEDFFTDKLPIEQEMMIDVFESIKNVYQHIKFHLILDVEVGKSFEDKETFILSSAVLKKDAVNHNIGKYLYHKIHSFCALRTRKRFNSSETYFDLDKFS